MGARQVSLRDHLPSRALAGSSPSSLPAFSALAASESDPPAWRQLCGPSHAARGPAPSICLRPGLGTSSYVPLLATLGMSFHFGKHRHAVRSPNPSRLASASRSVRAS